jgi:glycosyltransferase involved in cell wall biosynthesis
VRIGLVINSLDVGGAEILLCEQLRVSAKIAPELQFTVFVLRSGGCLEARARALGVEIVDLRQRFWADATPVPRLASECRRRGIELLHSHLPRSGWLSRLAARRARIPSVYTEHSDWGYSRWPMRMLNRTTLHLERRIFAVSTAVQAMARRHCPAIADRIGVVRNGVDAVAIRASLLDRAGERSRLGVRPDEHLLLSVGNLHVIKRHVDLIRAFARVRRVAGERTRLLIAGRNEGERRRLEREIEALRLAPAVVLAGARDDVPRLLAAADVFVLTSAFEGLPIALLEACAAGVPAVATAVGGVPEIIEDAVHGWLVPPRSPERLAGAVLDALRDGMSARRLAEAAQRRVTRHFSIEACVARYAAAYHGLAGSQ